jgi:hypothetical protein
MSIWSRISGEGLWRSILDSPNTAWNLDHVRSTILAAEERLHFQRIAYRIAIGLCGLWLALLAETIVTNYVHSAPRDITYGQVVGFAATLIAVVAWAYVQYRRVRVTRLGVKRLQLVLRTLKEDQQRRNVADADLVLAHQRRYRDDIPDVVQQYRDDANRYRKVHNRLQSVVIIGSVVTSALTTASVSFADVRWTAVGVSAVVGLSAGFTGYFKYRERSFNLQQTADAIERHYEMVELRVGPYSNKNEPDAYSLFANIVEGLRDDQNKRQQQLDQPAEGGRDLSAASQ